MSAPSPNASTELPEEGTLAEWPLPRLVLTLHARRFDGALVLRSGRQEKRFELERGAPVFVESNAPSESLCAQLVQKGLIDRSAQERVQGYVAQKGAREGVALMALQLLGPKELFVALKEQIRRRLVDCFAWPEGRFRIEPGAPRDGNAQALRCDPLSLTQEGLQTHWSIERMLTPLSPRMDQHPIPRKRFPKLMQRLRLSADETRQLAALDGRKPLGVALGSLFGSPRAIAAVWILDALDGIEYHDTPVGDSGDLFSSADTEIEIAVDGARAAATPAAAKAAPTPVADGGTKDAEGAALRAQIEKLRASLDELDHYQVLGLDRNVRAAAIKKAYIKAAKQYHPDTLARLGIQDLRQDASDVFARIGEAFEVLTDPGRRNDYDAELRGELTEKDAVRLAQAEKSYRKGEILLRMGDFAGAIEYLRPAVEIWPEETAYQSALGWALYKQTRSDPESARTYLEEAVRLGPDDATAHMRLGLVLRALGETDRSEKMTSIARRLDPNVG